MNSFQLSEHKSASLGDLVHLDIWGPYRVAIVDSYKYFLTIVDDFTRGVSFYLLKSKTKVFFWFFVFYNFLKNHFNSSIKVVRSDNGNEFVNFQFNLIFLIKMVFLIKLLVCILHNRLMLWKGNIDTC